MEGNSTRPLRDEGRALQCCTSDWISAASVLTGKRSTVRASAVAIGAVPPDRDGLDGLIERVGEREVLAVIESMSGARFVHDQLEIGGWDVRIADAVKARGLAPLACKTDTIDCWVLAELARLDLVPEIWLPDPAVRAERERTRFRQHLVKHRSSLKNRVHAILFQHGVPNPSSDLFGAGGRRLLARLALPEPWASTVRASLELIDTLDEQIDGCERKLVGYSGLCPRVEQSGERDRRGPLRKNGPNHLRWALVEAAHTAARHPAYSPVRDRMRARHGRKRGTKIAAIEIARRLSEAIWHMLTTSQPFAPAGAPASLAA